MTFWATATAGIRHPAFLARRALRRGRAEAAQLLLAQRRGGGLARTDVERGLDTAAQKDFGLVGSTPACKELGEEPRVIVTKDGMA
jgi:hypothetical protein